MDANADRIGTDNDQDDDEDENDAEKGKHLLFIQHIAILLAILCVPRWISREFTSWSIKW